MDRIGRYQIIGELGQGAMGVVYHATDPAIGRSVAIKVIRIRDIHDTAQREKLRERLFREARSAGVLSHPNIVTIYDMDEVDGLAYIAMAFVNGPTLEKILASEGALSGTRMLGVLRQTASALDYAHARGIVHRDVKPANIMTDEDGAVKITDFGIAKIEAGLTEAEAADAKPADAKPDDEQHVAGTPYYMSPEQIQGLAVDGRSDQFSLAVVAYEILTGERPFQGEHLSTVVNRILSEAPVQANRINSTLTPQIDAVLRRGLAKKPEERFANCSSFVGALEMACAESRGWKTLAANSAASLPAPEVKRQLPTMPQRLKPAPELISEGSEHRRKGLAPIWWGLAVLALAGLVVWGYGGIPGVVTFSQLPDVAAQPSPETPPVQPAAPAPAASTGDTNPNASASVAAPPDKTPVPDTPAAAAQPSPFQTDAAEKKPEQPVEASKEAYVEKMQDLWVTTNPPGAKVVLDDNLDQSCQAPCMLHGTAGVHHLTVSRAGYLNEYKQVRVGTSAPDIPMITLRQPGGSLMLTTMPPGATIKINGQPIPQLTPAEITLKPGHYSITVEKDGHSETQSIEMDQNMVYVRIPLEQ